MITNNNNRTRGRAYAAGSGEKKPYEGSKPLCSKCNYHHDGQCAPNATSVTELAIWPVTVGVLQMPTLLTTKGALGHVRNLLAMNVEPRDNSRGIVQS
ncbi:hypothetical protein Tco_0430681 [Tanacetum coccineum]